VIPAIAIAFDVESVERALELDRRLGEGPEHAKIGLELFTSAGPDAVRALARRGRRVFLDLKLHDIPNTVRGAAAAAARLGADLLTVHALGGEEMIRAAVEGVASANASTRVVAVTILTSLDEQRLPPGFARPLEARRTVTEMLAMALAAGAAGIVCSARDLADARDSARTPFLAVTPGIRPAGPVEDQRRVTTIGEAVRMGSSLMVIGRPITGASDPRQALEAARDERDAAAADLERTRS
jgi:orotidine-5'-phosphate decarboxylase